MSYRILIRAFTLRRDGASALLIAHYLRRFGCEVRVSSVREFNFMLRNWRPHAVIINTVGVVPSVHTILPQTRIVLWPGEGAEPDYACDATLLSKNPEHFDRLDLILTWGRFAMAQFKAQFSDRDMSKVRLSGNPRLDLVKFNPDIAKSRCNVPPSVGFIGRFNSLNHASGQSTLFSLRTANEANLDSVITQARSFVQLVQALRYIQEKTRFHGSIRPHPLESVNRYLTDVIREFDTSRMSADDSMDLASWSARQRSIVAPSSTSYIEGYLARVPMINTDVVCGTAADMDETYPLASLSRAVSHTPNTEGEMHELLSAENLPAPKANDRVDSHLDEAHDWNYQGSAVRRGCEHILDMLHRRAPDMRPLLPLWAADAIDRGRFFRARVNNPLHPEINYAPFYHKTPDYIRSMAAAL